MSRHNNTFEKLETSMSRADQIKLIQAAMVKKLNRNFREWGHEPLGELLNYNSPDGASMDAYLLFLTNLLLFLSKPDRAADFEEEVWNGREFIRKLVEFFDALQMPNMYDEYMAYYNLQRNDIRDFDMIGYARKYLKGEDLLKVLAIYGKTQ